MPTMKPALLALASLAALALACGEPTNTPTLSEENLPDHGEPPDPAADPLGARVHALGLERVRRYTPLESHSGTLGEGEVLSHDIAVEGTYCYAILAVGAETITNLDLVALDPAGRAFQHDPEQSNIATLGLGRRFCLDGGALVRVRVRAFRGQGEYALKVYRHRVL